MGDFTLRFLKNMEKTILRKCILSMWRVGQREKTNSALTSPSLNIDITHANIYFYQTQATHSEPTFLIFLNRKYLMLFVFDKYWSVFEKLCD